MSYINTNEKHNGTNFYRSKATILLTKLNQAQRHTEVKRLTQSGLTLINSIIKAIPETRVP